MRVATKKNKDKQSFVLLPYFIPEEDTEICAQDVINIQ